MRFALLTLATQGAHAFTQARELALFRLEKFARARDERVGFLDLRGLLGALGLGGGDVVAVTLDQFANFLGALAVELDPAAVGRHLAV